MKYYSYLCKEQFNKLNKMETINDHLQVYCVWVNGRGIDDENQEFPIDSNIDQEWHDNFKRATADYFGCVPNTDSEFGTYSDIYKDCHIVLYSIDINIKKFENMYDLDFNINCDECQEMIPYYVDYDFNVVAERITELE